MYLWFGQVQVYTRSWQKEAKAYCWESDGSGSYEIEEVDGQRRGTKIVIKLKEDFMTMPKRTGSRISSKNIPYCSVSSLS